MFAYTCVTWNDSLFLFTSVIFTYYALLRATEATRPTKREQHAKVMMLCFLTWNAMSSLIFRHQLVTNVELGSTTATLSYSSMYFFFKRRTASTSNTSPQCSAVSKSIFWQMRKLFQKPRSKSRRLDLLQLSSS